MSIFIKNVSKLGSGAIASQLIALATMPLITRLFPPETFGIFSVYYSIVAVLFPLSTLRFNNAIPLPKDQKTAQELLFLSHYSVIASSVVIAFFCLAVLVMWEEQPDYFGVAFIIAIVSGVLIQGWLQTSRFWSLRLKLFGVLGVSRIAESVVDRLLVLALAISGCVSFYVLIAGRIFGPLFAFILLYKNQPKVRKSTIGILPISSDIKKTANRYRRFPLVSTWAFLIANISRESPIWILMFFFDPLITGMYALGQRVLNVPAQMLGESLAKVFLQKCAEDRSNNKDVTKNTLRLLKMLIYIIFPGTVVLVLFGEDLFSIVFGSKWRDAGIYAAILAPLFSIMFIYRIFSIFFDIFEKQIQRLFFDILNLLLRVLAISLPALFGLGIEKTLIIFSAVSFGVFFMGIILLLKIVEISLLRLFLYFLNQSLILLPVISGFIFLVSINRVSELDVASKSLLLSFVLIIQLLVFIVVDSDIKVIVARFIQQLRKILP